MGSSQTNKALTFKAIVNDGNNWQCYQEQYAGRVSAHQIAEVNKMLRCGTAKNGYATYICLSCGNTKQVCFSCKSRVCAACGKIYADDWAQSLTKRLFNVTHRHITFTIAAELWPILERTPDLRKVLFGAANRTLRQVLKMEPGIVMVMHPYGKDLKVNYHLHVLVTEGGMTSSGQWIAQPFLNYSSLRKIWQYECLTELRQQMPKSNATAQLIDQLFKTYRNGFYVHAKPQVTQAQGISRYIGRYIRHPAIADARILAYDGTAVTFFYEDHEGLHHEQTWPVLAFIHGVVRHIPPKHFKLVRYFGLYAPRKAALVQAILHHIGRMLGRTISRLTWQSRLKRDFDHDPLQCLQCGQTGMVLYSLTVPDHGQFKTFGGLVWLFARGDLVETPPISRSSSPPKPSPIPFTSQSTFALEVAP